MTAKLDRLSRSPRDFLALIARAQRDGWTLVTLSPELDLSKPKRPARGARARGGGRVGARHGVDRAREGLDGARLDGVALGSPRRIPPDIEARILREHGERRSYNGIARGLNSDGVPTAHGGIEWYPTTVRAVVVASRTER